MELLIEVIKIIVQKYMDKVNVIITENHLVLEFLYYRYDEMDVYKSIEIRQFEGKLKVTFIPERTERIIDVAEIEDIIQALDKQSKAKNPTQEEVRYIREKYKVGTKVELIKMYDLINPVPSGTKGIIDHIDDIGTLHINWETGSTLGLEVGTDEFKVLEEKE